MKPGRLRAVRWTGMAIVFQGALHTLNPVQRMGRQIGEAIDLHSRRATGAADAKVGELLELVGLPGAPRRRLPAPALGRPAPARADRARARVRPAAARRRRADDGARRDGAGADPAPARRAPARAPARDAVHHARPLDARRRLPTGSPSCTPGGSSRRGRRTTSSRRRASLHARARRGASRSSATPPSAKPVGPAGRPARSARAAVGLPVPPALPGRARAVPERRPSSCWPPGEAARAACVEVLGRRERDGAAARAARPARALPRPAAAPSRAPSTASTSTLRAGRGARARRRVGLRQDDPGAHDHRARAAGLGRGPLPRRAAALRPRARCAPTGARCRWSSRTRPAR